MKNFDNLLEKAKAKPPVLYAMDTIDEFHNLFVSTLIVYACTLQRVYELTESPESLEQEKTREQRQQ